MHSVLSHSQTHFLLHFCQSDIVGGRWNFHPTSICFQDHQKLFAMRLLRFLFCIDSKWTTLCSFFASHPTSTCSSSFSLDQWKPTFFLEMALCSHYLFHIIWCLPYALLPFVSSFLRVCRLPIVWLSLISFHVISCCCYWNLYFQPIFLDPKSIINVGLVFHHYGCPTLNIWYLDTLCTIL